jgi:photoactive yellow protein
MSTMPAFDQPGLAALLRDMSPEPLDALAFGVIAFNNQYAITRYNLYESRAANFPAAEVIGQDVFVALAPCLNNYLVAGRFEACLDAGEALDEQMPYVLTFRMRPTRVRLRLLAEPGAAERFILVQRALPAQN